MEGLQVIGPGEPGHGQYYPSYCRQWIEWLVSNNPESNNYGPVFFLHCVPPCQQENSSQIVSSYGTRPIVRIGTQAISIKAGNYVFLPIITSAAETIDNGVPDNPATLLNYVRADLEAGDNPPAPNQATIVDATDIDPDTPNPKTRMVPIVPGQLDRHCIITDVFPLDVPPAQPGSKLLRTCFDVPINTVGVRNCCLGGYWILMQFTIPGKKYYICSFSRGRGSYQSGMFYEIDVSGFNEQDIKQVKRIKDGRVRTNDEINRIEINRIVKQLVEDEQIDKNDEKIIKHVLG